MNVAVSMIAMNEEDYISRAIKSCGFATYVCLVDGGSEDDTIEAARASVPPSTKLTVREVPWKGHFGRARQAAYDMLPPDTDWWMRLDSDEAYSAAYREGVLNILSMLPEEIHAIRIRQTNLVGDESHYAANLGGFETHPRIFRYIRGDELYHMWVGEVHEFVQVMSLDGLNPILNSSIATWSAQVFHYGWLDDNRRLDREQLYMQMKGSGVTQVGDLTGRTYAVRAVPEEAKR